MAENKMEQVAELLGKTLNTPFRIKYSDRRTYTIIIMEDGVHQIANGDYAIDFDIFHVLFTGEAEIVEG